eukprot:snap_masked-scaffold_4-processed-gene-1.9-mRNA-1 protein AED:1.00 eAED:1.00 QI:0/-1/0/0/-1/1/1/0/221
MSELCNEEECCKSCCETIKSTFPNSILLENFCLPGCKGQPSRISLCDNLLGETRSQSCRAGVSFLNKEIKFINITSFEDDETSQMHAVCCFAKSPNFGVERNCLVGADSPNGLTEVPSNAPTIQITEADPGTEQTQELIRTILTLIGLTIIPIIFTLVCVLLWITHKETMDKLKSLEKMKKIVKTPKQRVSGRNPKFIKKFKPRKESYEDDGRSYNPFISI